MQRWTSTLLASSLLLALLPASSMIASARPVTVGAPHAQRGYIDAGPDVSPSKKLQHIIVIVQENRSLDNLFNGFCVNGTICADTVTTDPVTGTPLVPESLAAPFDPFHDRSAFVIEYDNGKMDGFSKDVVVCNGGVKPCPYSVFSYVPSSETTVYQQLATQDGELSDMTFQTDQAPTFPSHYYAIAGQSGGGYQGDPGDDAVDSGSGSCKTKTVVNTIDVKTGKAGPKSVSCQDFPTIFDLLAKKNHTWRYYSDSTAGFFSATQAIQHLYGSPNFVTPSSQFITDVANGNLADVTYIMPKSEAASDHPGNVTNPAAGPEWVASLVNAVGATPYWNDTAIVMWWDDWGGWYDHVQPNVVFKGMYTDFEYSFRVPLIVMGGYARTGTMDHEKRTFVGAIRLIEDTFKLGTLHTTDALEPDGLEPMFDFGHKPHPYVPVGGSDARPFRSMR
jgi:phospholipase C